VINEIKYLNGKNLLGTGFMKA